MLKLSLMCNRAHRRYLSYFSNAFNNLANQGSSTALGPVENIRESANNFDLDVFINQDHRHMDLLDKLIKLRKQKLSTTVPLSPIKLVRQLIDYSGPQEAVNVLRNPLQYGIFIDKFTGCYLIDFLLHNGNVREAAQVSALLVDRELCNNELVAALSLRSLYALVKNYQSSLPKKIGDPLEVEKVRVKFLRNHSENVMEKTEEQILGESLIKLSLNANLDSQLKKNASLLGFVLCNDIIEAEKCLAQNENMLLKDVLLVCCKLITYLEEQTDSKLKSLVEKQLEVCLQSKSFDDILDSRVKLLATSTEPQLILEYAETNQKWEINLQRAVKEQIKLQDEVNRDKSIQNTLISLQSTRQALWFFENQEDIEIQIYKKKVYYPKRWFGKKKKPKAVDAFYVPPNISRGN